MATAETSRNIANSIGCVGLVVLACKKNHEGQLFLIQFTCLKDLLLQAPGHVCHHGIYHSRVLQVPRLFVSIFGFEIQRRAERPCCAVEVGSSVCRKILIAPTFVRKSLCDLGRMWQLLRVPVLGGAQIIAFCGLIETTGFFQADSTTSGRGPREGQFAMKDSTEADEPGNYGVGFPNFIGKVEDPETRKSKLAAELANGRLAMMAIIGMFFQEASPLLGRVCFCVYSTATGPRTEIGYLVLEACNTYEGWTDRLSVGRLVSVHGLSPEGHPDLAVVRALFAVLRSNMFHSLARICDEAGSDSKVARHCA